MEQNKHYKTLTKRHTPPTPMIKTLFFSFFFGGLICAMGEALRYLYVYMGASYEDSFTLVTLTFILVASLLTAFGVFDLIARVAGAGTLVPVTGFANSVVCCALDARSEGYILGVGSKIFTVAGPVILFSTLSGILYGIIYFVCGILF